MTRVGADADRDLRRVLLLLAPAIMLVVATEFIVVGLLPPIAADFTLPLSAAGQLTAVFAIAAAVAGPFVTLAVSRVPAPTLLTAVLVLFGMGNGVIAVAADFTLVLVMRAIQGAFLPALIGVGTAEVLRHTPAGTRGRALARANLGFVLGVLIALPAGIALAQGGQWRLSFVVLAVVSLPVAAAVAILFPRNQMSAPPPPVSGNLAVLRGPRFLGHLALSVVIFAAMFSAYTYLGAWLEDAIGLDAGGLALAMLLFGAVGVAGNVAAERVADRFPLAASAFAAVVLAVAVNAAAWTGGSILAAAIPFALWSLMHTAGVTLSQVRVTLAGAKAPAFAMTMNISAANLGIAVGALTGGWAVDRFGMVGLGSMPAALTVLALLLVLPLRVARTQGRMAST
ncbi:MFS transporter [Mycobacterium sp. AMU20-3851]|uniref:MFS transporter n=1 Tax=Mycobacterium sp. AMU20-3851 TaxID=3122055 RepID=UPI00375503C9